MRDSVFFSSQIITGLATGGIYALVALGFVLIYKSTDVINFAQGDLLMVGAYVGWALSTAGLPFPVAFVLTLIVAAFLGLLIERIVLRPMIGEPIIAVIIVTLGLSSMLRGMVFFVASTEVRRFPEDIFPITPLQLGPFFVPQIYAWALAIAALAVLVLTGFFRFSRQGIALRAAADDQQAAMSMGIRISWAFALSWALSAAVAAAAGILLGNLTGVNFTLRHRFAGVPRRHPGRAGQHPRRDRRWAGDRRTAEPRLGLSGPMRRRRPEERLPVLRPGGHPDAQALRPVRPRTDRTRMTLVPTRLPAHRGERT